MLSVYVVCGWHKSPYPRLSHIIWSLLWMNGPCQSPVTTIYGRPNCSGWPPNILTCLVNIYSLSSLQGLVRWCRVDTRLVIEGGKTVRPSIREMFWWINSIKFCGLWQVLLLIWHYDCHFGVREQRLEGGGRWKKLQTNFRRNVALCKSSGA